MVAHRGGVDPRPAQPGLLHDVLGVGGDLEHLVGHREEQRPQRLELGRVGDRRPVGVGRTRHPAAVVALGAPPAHAFEGTASGSSQTSE